MRFLLRIVVFPFAIACAVLAAVTRLAAGMSGALLEALGGLCLLCALFALMTLTAGQLPWLNQEILADSWGLRLFNDINPFL